MKKDKFDFFKSGIDIGDLQIIIKGNGDLFCYEDEDEFDELGYDDCEAIDSYEFEYDITNNKVTFNNEDIDIFEFDENFKLNAIDEIIRTLEEFKKNI